MSGEIMAGWPFEEGALAIARLVLINDREALVIVYVAPQSKRTALAALLAIPWPRDVVKTVGTRSFAVVTSSQPRQSVFEPLHTDLTYSEGEDGLRRRDASVGADIFAWLSPVERINVSSNLEEMRISIPGDLKSIPLSELH